MLTTFLVTVIYSSKNYKIKFLDVHRESDFFYDRIRSMDTIDCMMEASLDMMRQVGISPRVSIHGEEADQKWKRAQIV